jgi:hypothetical protein
MMPEFADKWKALEYVELILVKIEDVTGKGAGRNSRFRPTADEEATLKHIFKIYPNILILREYPKYSHIRSARKRDMDGFDGSNY